MEAEQQAMMVMAGKWEQRTLMNELAQGKELAQRLKTHLAAPSSPETRRLLTERILECYEKALSLLNCRDIDGGGARSRDSIERIFSFLRESPTSGIIDQQNPHDVSKKRKTLSPRCTEDVRVVSGSGQDGPPGDGYNWRKYGQKDILGSKFPRGYYRCTCRHVQGCLATKQVQRSDNDPNVFEVAYRGRHTCRSSHSLVQSQPQIKDGPTQEQDDSSRLQTFNQTLNGQLPNQSKSIDFNFTSDLRLKNEEIDTREETFQCFSFDGETSIFRNALEDNNFLVPEMLEPDYLSMGHMSGLTSETDPHEIVSAPTSVTNSPIGDLSFLLENSEFDLDFLLEDPKFF